MDITNIKNLCELVLAKSFPNNKEKRQIKLMSNRLNMACFACGDSHNDSHKKRGNLYLNNLFYKCYNCSYKGTLLNMLKDSDIEIDIEDKLKLSDYVSEAMDKMKFNEEEFLSKSLDKLISIEKLTEEFNTNKHEIRNFRPVQKDSPVYNYLVGRHITDFENIYEANFYYTSKWFEPVMININQSKGKILGIQTRNLKEEKDKRRFKVYKFSELYHMVYPDGVLDEIETIGYDKLSYIYNIFNVDWSKPITVFEGYLDSKFFPNSVGLVGTNTDVNLLLSQEADIRFLYDYDKTGIKKSIKMLKQGYSVFLWEKLFKMWSSKSKTPEKAYRVISSEIIDMNDIAKRIDNPYRKLKMEDYFSLDEFDIFYIKNLE